MNDLHCNAKTNRTHIIRIRFILSGNTWTLSQKNQCLDFRFMNSLANNTKSDKFAVRSSVLLNRMQAHRRAESYYWISACLLHDIFSMPQSTQTYARCSHLEYRVWFRCIYENHYIWLASIERHSNWQMNLYEKHTPKFNAKWKEKLQKKMCMKNWSIKGVTVHIMLSTVWFRNVRKGFSLMGLRQMRSFVEVMCALYNFVEVKRARHNNVWVRLRFH